MTTTFLDVHDVYRKWLGPDYDLGVINANLCAAACEQLDGDPPWLLTIAGSGSAKTETVAPFAAVPRAVMASTISSEGALLSATSNKERTKDATGGLLRRVGDRGLLIVKDFTSTLSMSRDARAAVLAALREIYDGRWDRNVGTDGGKTRTWQGRIVVLGASTSKYDHAHTVIAAMGDRFCLSRLDSRVNRKQAGRQALRNVSSERTMRGELSDVVAGALHGLVSYAPTLRADDEDRLLGLADVVSLARTAVERDHMGRPLEAHDPEMPTRLAKQLGQIARGGIALGYTADEAMAVATRVAVDTMPPGRLAVLRDIHRHPADSAYRSAARLAMPYTSVDRYCQELAALGLFTQHKAEGESYRYTIADAVNEADLTAVTGGLSDAA
jgi:hypothetical protein